MADTVNVAFIGNPNCGKTTLFNAYTGARLKVANWPGVTVEKKEGAFRYHDHDFKLVDLPGIYSLTSYTMEEKVARRYILSEDADVIIDVVDASCLERNLYLTLQLIELGKPVVVALNMMDIVEERGMEIDLHRLPEMLGVPVVPVSARKRRGLDVLMHAVSHHKGKGIDALEHQHKSSESKHKHDHHSEYTVVYSDEIEDLLDTVEDRISEKLPQTANKRWHAIKILEQDEDVTAELGIDFSDIVSRSYEKEIINQKYDFIEEIIEECLVNKSVKAERTEKIDALLTHPVLGVPVFLVIMAVVFMLTFKVGDFLAEWLSMGIDLIASLIERILVGIDASPVVQSLILDGIIAGVGGILTFLPNIFILFLCLAFLEDSGYMSRVAYVMDGIMGKIGLSGRAFIPMLLGFGCTVPAVMASRALENKKDRLRTIIITPFMSCSARLPIYVLFSNLFFHEHAMIVAYSMYLIGIVVAILVALL
ncbi:MAG: ferrous iron transport protein B, partial [Clostridia bacterium]